MKGNAKDPAVFFGDAVWLNAWCDAFANGRPIVTVGSGDGLVTCLLRSRTQINGVWLKSLISPTNCHTPRYGWRLHNQTTDALEDVIAALFDENDSEIIDIELVSADSSTFQSFARLQSRGARVEIRPWTQTAVIDVTSPVELYMRSLPKKLRANTNRAENRLRDISAFQFRDVARSSDFDGMLTKAWSLELCGWKGRDGTAVAQHPEEKRFYQTILNWARNNDSLRFFVLELGSELIAYNILLCSAGSYYGIKTSFSEAYRQYSPGNVLQRLVIQELMADNAAMTLDMLDPATPWKQQWATEVTDLYRITAYSRRLKAQGCYWTRAIGSRARSGWRSVKSRLNGNGNARVSSGCPM
jgi:hypothetical protein